MNFWRLVWASFWSIQNGLVGLAGLLVATLTITTSPTSTLTFSFGLFVTLLVVLILVLSTLARAAYLGARAANPVLPQVIGSTTSPSGTGAVLIVLSPSTLFSQDVAVSVYCRRDEFEFIVGIGFVETVREDKKIQVALTYPIPGYEDTIAQLKNNDRSIHKKLVVKPTVPQAYLEFVSRGK